MQIDPFIFFVLMISLLVLLGHFGEQIRHATSSLFRIVALEEFVGHTTFHCSSMVAKITAFNRRTLEGHPVEDSDSAAAVHPPVHHLDRIIGGALLTLCTAVILAFLLILASQTFNAMGLANDQIPGSISFLGAVADGAVGIACGIILCDLVGWTHVLPPLSLNAKKLLWPLVILSLLASVLYFVYMNSWRSTALVMKAREEAKQELNAGSSDSSISYGSLVPGHTATKTAINPPATPTGSSQIDPLKEAESQSDAGRKAFTLLTWAGLITTLMSVTGTLVFVRYLWVWVVGLLLVVPIVLAIWLLPCWPRLIDRIESFVLAGLKLVSDFCRPIVDLVRVPLSHAVAGWHHRSQEWRGGATAPVAPEAPVSSPTFSPSPAPTATAPHGIPTTPASAPTSARPTPSQPPAPTHEDSAGPEFNDFDFKF